MNAARLAGKTAVSSSTMETVAPASIAL